MRYNVKWQDRFLFDLYELAKAGTKEKAMARMLQISFPTFVVWEKRKPLFALALRLGRLQYKKRTHRHKSEIESYIYNRLSQDERKCWRKLQAANRAKTGAQTLNAILEGKGKLFRQHLFIHAMIHNNYSITGACRAIGIDVHTWEKWRTQDPEFLKLFKVVQEAKKDRLEDHFFKLTDSNDVPSVLHGLKTLARDRGYGDKQEIDVNVSGQVNHNLVQIDINLLPLETRKQVLEAVRKAKQIPSTVVETNPLTPALPAAMSAV